MLVQQEVEVEDVLGLDHMRMYMTPATLVMLREQVQFICVAQRQKQKQNVVLVPPVPPPLEFVPEYTIVDLLANNVPVQTQLDHLKILNFVVGTSFIFHAAVGTAPVVPVVFVELVM